MPNWMTTAWNYLRSLPVARYIKPLWKGALQEAAQRGGDALQSEIDKQLAEKGAAALVGINAQVDKAQERIGGIVDGLPFVPADLKAKVKQAINAPVDALQERLRAGCASGCVETAQKAFDVAFDKFQGDLAEAIGKL